LGIYQRSVVGFGEQYGACFAQFFSALDQVIAHTQLSPWGAAGPLCIGLAPVAITYGLQSVSDSTVIT
jgi:hypothetical protein